MRRMLERWSDAGKLTVAIVMVGGGFVGGRLQQGVRGRRRDSPPGTAAPGGAALAEGEASPPESAFSGRIKTRETQLEPAVQRSGAEKTQK